MRTYIIVTTEIELNSGAKGRHCAIFDYIEDAEEYISGSSATNSMGDKIKLRVHERVITTFTIFAKDILEAHEKAFELRKRF